MCTLLSNQIFNQTHIRKHLHILTGVYKAASFEDVILVFIRTLIRLNQRF